MRSFSKFTLSPKKFRNLLWAHRPSKPTIYFLDMPTPMGDFLCLLLRLDVKRLMDPYWSQSFDHICFTNHQKDFKNSFSGKPYRKKSFCMKVIFVMVIQMVPKIEKKVTWYGQSIVMRGEPMHPLTFCNMTHPITSGLYQPTTPLRWGCWCTMLQNFYFTSFSFVH